MLRNYRKKPLTREEWVTLGGQFRETEAALQRLAAGVEAAAGAQLHDRTVRALSYVAKTLDRLVGEQHPDWPHAGKVFYGPEEPKP